MPVVTRGKKADKPGGPSGTRVFQGWKKGGFDEYTLKETGKKGRKARVGICVHVRNRNGRRGKYGRERLVYAFWGWQPRQQRAVSELYRLRFGIETSYRQLGEAKAKTCTRSPEVRLFLNRGGTAIAQRVGGAAPRGAVPDGGGITWSGFVSKRCWRFCNKRRRKPSASSIVC